MSTDVPSAASEVSGEGNEVVSFGPFRLDRGNGLLYRDGDEVAVQPKALAILDYLVERPKKTVSKGELLDKVWDGTAVTEHSLIETVRILRQTLGDNPRSPTYIQTVSHRGYQFIAPVYLDGERPDTTVDSESAHVDLETVSLPQALLPAILYIESFLGGEEENVASRQLRRQDSRSIAARAWRNGRGLRRL